MKDGMKITDRRTQSFMTCALGVLITREWHQRSRKIALIPITVFVAGTNGIILSDRMSNPERCINEKHIGGLILGLNILGYVRVT